MIDINELTLGQIKELKNSFGNTCDTSPPSSQNNTVKIVILQRGWVVVGRWFQKGEQCRIENGYVIRVWGTSNGLGELAENGPQSSTKLDSAKTLRFHELTVVATMDCNESKWGSKCEKL